MKSYLHRATQDSVFLTCGMMKIMMMIIIILIIIIIIIITVIIIKIKHYNFFLMWNRNVFWTRFSTSKTFRTLRELQIITKIYFCIRHRNRQKHNHYFNLNIYIWKSKFTSHKQYLFGLVFSGNAKKTHTEQSILQFSLLCLKRSDSQSFKSSNCKENFSPVCIFFVQLASKVFLFRLITGRFCFEQKFVFVLRFVAITMLWILGNKCFETLVKTSCFLHQPQKLGIFYYFNCHYYWPAATLIALDNP